MKPLKMSYSELSIPMFWSFPLILSSCGISGLICDKIGLSEEETKNILIVIACIDLVVFIASFFVMRFRHSVTIDEKGITIKDGKTKTSLVWGDIKHISHTGKVFKCLEIETIYDSNVIILPLQFFIKRYWNEEEKKEFFAQLDSYISKFNSDYLYLEENNTNKLTTYQPYISNTSYTLQRKSNIGVALAWSILIIVFFAIFPIKHAIGFSVVYFVILLLMINYSKDDLVFDAVGITIYHKHEMVLVPWEKVTNIEFYGRETLIIDYKNDENKIERKTWDIVCFSNVNGDVYDYFVNVSKLRGKSAIDHYKYK